jgi:hypothetical protein
MIGNPDYKGKMDYTPFQKFEAADRYQFQNFISGEWAWKQVVCLRYYIVFSHQFPLIDQDIIAEDLDTHGSMFVLIILSSDKTTVSVGTGHNEYYPLYASIGNVHNDVCWAHQNAIVLIGFLTIPKSMPFSFLYLLVFSSR